MSSRDYGFLTLRNIVAYQSNGDSVPANDIFVTSSNGTAIFSDNVKISTINISTLNTNTFNVSTCFSFLLKFGFCKTKSIKYLRIKN